MKTINYLLRQRGYNLSRLAFVWFLILISSLLSSCNGAGSSSTNSNGLATQNSKLITDFSINNQHGVNDGNIISIVLPYGTNLTQLSPIFTTTGQAVRVGSNAQVSGQSVNDFSKPITYSVRADDGTTKNYLVKALLANQDSKSITQFSVSGIAGVISGNRISVVLPYNTSSTSSLIASFSISGTSVSIGDATQISGQTPNNFTNPLIYTVTAADGTQKSYVVSVTIAKNTQKAITQFFANNVAGVITGNSISVVLPYGSEVSDLAPTFATSGINVSIAGVNQISGQTANNFTTPKIYTVTAADNSTAIYTVTIIIAKNPQKAITNFSIDNISGVISSNTISVVVPYGTNITSMIATFTNSGVSVNVGSTTQVSGQTANNFTNPVAYTVTAADGTTQIYSVIVTIAKDPQNSITQYSINNVSGVFNGTSISVVLPYGTTDLSNLIATFTQNGAGVSVNSVNQVSGQTSNDFTHQIVYTVTAVDGTTQNYYVNVSVAQNSQKAITQFSINNVPGVISGNYISVVLPYSTESLANLTATFTSNGANVSVDRITQISGQTQNSFTQPSVYIVTAADGSTTNYTVVVSIALNTQKAITQFSINNVPGVITGNSISVALPYGTPLTNLEAIFATTASSVSVAGTTQTSGQSVNNFTSALNYTVTAADGSTLNYSVSVSWMPDTHKSFTKFAINNINGVISENNGGNNIITVTLPYGTNLSDLIATFTITGDSVKLGNIVQISGQTANSFSSPCTYTVVAADGSSKQYVVTVNIAANSQKAVTQFMINNVAGTINGNTISIQLPHDTPNLNQLTAAFTTTGESVTVNGAKQVSGQTSNNFAIPVIYTVTAADGTTEDYVVRVYIQPGSQKAIVQFAIGSHQGIISGNSIIVSVPARTLLNGLIATFVTSGVNVSAGGVIQVSGQTPNNFTSPVIYTVTAANGATQNYTVSIQQPYPFFNPSNIVFNSSATLAYIADGNVVRCSASGGTLSNCQSTTTSLGRFGATFGLYFNLTESYAYAINDYSTLSLCTITNGDLNNDCHGINSNIIVQSNLQFTPDGTGVYYAGSIDGDSEDNYLNYCTIASDGELTNCVSTNYSVAGERILLDPSGDFIYIWGGQSSIRSCPINQGTIGVCTDSGATNIYFPMSYAISPSGQYMYIINYPGSTQPYITQCSVSNGRLSNCTNSGANGSPYNRTDLTTVSVDMLIFTITSDGSINYCSIGENGISGCMNSGAWLFGY